MNPTEQEGGLQFKDLLPKAVEGSYQRILNGYTAEFKIPLTELSKFQPNGWENFRFNIIVSDNTSTHGDIAKVSWQPGWAENIPGTGMFFNEK